MFCGLFTDHFQLSTLKYNNRILCSGLTLCFDTLMVLSEMYKRLQLFGKTDGQSATDHIPASNNGIIKTYGFFDSHLVSKREKSALL